MLQAPAGEREHSRHLSAPDALAEPRATDAPPGSQQFPAAAVEPEARAAEPCGRPQYTGALARASPPGARPGAPPGAAPSTGLEERIRELISETEAFRAWLDSGVAPPGAGSARDVRARVERYKRAHGTVLVESFVPGEMPVGLSRAPREASLTGESLLLLGDRELAALGEDFSTRKSLSSAGRRVRDVGLSAKERQALLGEKGPDGGTLGAAPFSLTIERSSSNSPPVSQPARGGAAYAGQRPLISPTEPGWGAEPPQERMSVSPTSLQSLWNQADVDSLGMLM